MAKHAKHARTDDTEAKKSDSAQAKSVPSDASPQKGGEFVASAHHHKASRRMRIVLIVVSVVLVLLMAALGYFAWMLVNEASDAASYQSTVQTEKVDKGESAPASDAGKSAAARKEAPRLADLIGKSENEAIEAIGRGATETSAKDITEETGEGDDKTTEVVGRSVTLALTDETTDAKGNTPSVYLTLDEDGTILEAGYSASVGSLGYGDVSFVDAVTSEHLVENLVDAAGMEIEEGSIEMPAVEDYRTYADDGKTIAQELYTFGGEASGSDGSSYAWSCRLSYDYSAANVSGNLADTIRQVYVYVKAAS